MEAADRYRGCMVGLAVGDALGAPVEFLSRDAIVARFGPHGVSELWPSLHRPLGEFPAGSITDDTQMSIATARACLAAPAGGGRAQLVAAAWREYVAWSVTQSDPRERRGPGATCLAALAADGPPPTGTAANHSKGCGAVMRAAPVGLLLPPAEAFDAAADLGRLTHGHPSGFLSGGALAAIVAGLVRGARLEQAIGVALELLERTPGHEETAVALRAAVELAGDVAGVEQSDPNDVANTVASLGEGWVGEEALAIAVYCVLRFPRDWRRAVLAAVNHGGDSDSTGSIAGALAGAALGLAAVPAAWAAIVERRDELLELADALCEAARCV